MMWLSNERGKVSEGGSVLVLSNATGEGMGRDVQGVARDAGAC